MSHLDFWDKTAKRYSAQPIKDEAAYEKKLELTRKYLKPDFEVLEFGCGTGGTALKHAPFVKHIRATDVSENMLAYGREKQVAAGIDNVTFEQLEIERETLPENAYDMVLGMSVLHLMQDKEKVIRSVFSTLRPGGYFVSSTVCVGGGKWLLRKLLPIGQKFGLLPYVSFFSDEELQKAMIDAGFQIVEHFRPAPDAAVFLIARKPALAA